MHYRTIRTHLGRSALASAAAIAAACLLASSAKGATIDIADGSEYTLSAGDNVDGNTLRVAGSATLKLSGAAVNGEFTLNPEICFSASGTLTVDASAVAGCSTVRMINHLRDWDAEGQGKLSFMQPVSRVLFGSEGNSDGIIMNSSSTPRALPVFDMDVEVAAEGGLVVFTNCVSLVRLPASCDYSIAAAARIALMSDRILGAGNYTLSGFNAQMCSTESFANGATITVSDGCKLFARPVYFLDNTPMWYGFRTSFTNNVVLGGANANLIFQNNNAGPSLRGNITGTGNVEFAGNAEMVFYGELGFTGRLTLNTTSSSSDVVHKFYLPDGFTVTPTIVFNTTRVLWLALFPAGYATSDTTLRLSAVESTSTAVPYMSIPARCTVTAASLSGKCGVEPRTAGKVSSFVVESLKSTAKLYVKAGVDLTIKAFEEGAKVILVPGSDGSQDWSISGPSTGTAIRLPIDCSGVDSPSASISLGGRLELPEEMPFKTVTVKDGAEISANILQETQVKNNGGAFTHISSRWKEKVALWTDASDTNTMTYARDAYTNELGGTSSTELGWLDPNQIIEWRDRRGDRSVRFRSVKFDAGTTRVGETTRYIIPFLQKTEERQSLYFSTTSTRARMQVSNGFNNLSRVSAKCALLVFNGSQGGGNALLFDADKKLCRKPSATDALPSPGSDTPLIYSSTAGVSFRTNGVAVAQPAQTPLTGGWQMIAIQRSEGLSIEAIGPAHTADNSSKGNGGQIYAEIMLFDQMPTENELKEAEKYLARKWNLPLGYDPGPDDLNISLFGEGDVTIDGDVVASNGVFRGTVDLNGHRMTISSNALPLTEDAIPAENRILWVDPSVSGSIVLGSDPEKADEVAYLYSRDNAGAITSGSGYYLTSPYSSQTDDRRVRAVSGSRGGGPALPWLVFSENYGGEVNGNNLMIRELPYSPMTSLSDPVAEIGVKAGFFALDTVSGGGSVILSRANGSTEGGAGYTARSLSTDPIFNANCAEAVRSADAWLDWRQVDPSVSSYSLKPEVFSFTLQEEAAAPTVKAIGFYGNTAANAVILGEMILYSTTQTDEVREGIAAYLEAKWFNTAYPGYSDFRNMTVTGSGTLAAPGLEYMPALGGSFSGTVELSCDTVGFTLPSGGGNAAMNVADFPGSLSLPPSVTVDIEGRGVLPGTYRLISAGTFPYEDTEFTLGTVAGCGNRIITLKKTSSGLFANVAARGAVMIVR